MQSVVNYEVEPPAGCEHRHIHIEDTNDANLLDHLGDAVDFIQEAADDGGKVLVHCHNGVSRSAAVVLAFMCISKCLQVVDAIELLRMECPSAAPNSGFMQQIGLFVAMGCVTLCFFILLAVAF
jgi:dual specificity phosphatase 12